MNTVSYTTFNENAKHYLDSLADSNQEIIIVKNKKPAFRILPLNAGSTNNLLKDSIIFEQDIIDPIDQKWEAE